MSARDEVLARVRAALAGAPPARTAVPRAYRPHGDHPPGDPALLDLLDERLVDYAAAVRRTTAAGLAAAVAAALTAGLAKAGADVHGSGGRPRLIVPPGLPGEWLAETDADVVRDAALDAAALDGFDGVVTGAAVAVAETGTIVLDGSSDQGRRAISLVPDLHVCVVPAGRVVASVPEAVERLDPTLPLTWISGPSATSDIELDRVVGVHGPRTLEVVLVE